MGIIQPILLASCLTLSGPIDVPHGVTEILQQNSEIICVQFPEAVEERLIEENNPVLSYMSDMTADIRDSIRSIDSDIQNLYQQKIEEEQERIAQQEARYQEIAENIQNGLDNISSPGINWCAKYVSQVYQYAGYKYPGGNADDMYYQYCNSSDINELRDGMIVAVPSWNGDYMSYTYGHVGIYMNGEVWHNIGSIERTPLDEWIDTYGQISEVRWGFAF